MAVPFGSLTAGRGRILPVQPNILGNLADQFLAGRDAARTRAYEAEAPGLILGALGMGTGSALGSLVPTVPTVPRQLRDASAAPLGVPGGGSFVGASADATTTYRPPAATGQPAMASATGAGGMETYRNAIANIESGGRYDLVGPPANASGDRAYGKYQVMGSNVGPWTEQVLGQRMTSEQFLASPQAQDAVFDAIFGGYVQRYGPDGAATAWFAGPGAVGGSGNTSDVLGTTVSSYVQQFNSGLSQPGGQSGGRTPPAAAGGAATAPWSPPSAQEQEVLRRMIANPLTREQGIALATQRMTPEPRPLIEVGGQLYDPNSGQWITPPAAPPEPEGLMTVGENSAIYDPASGQWITPPASTGGPGDREYREDQNGVLRFVDTGEPVFPNVSEAPDTDAPETKVLVGPDGQLHLMAWNPATGAFDRDQGLADPGGQFSVSVGADGALEVTQGRPGSNMTVAAGQNTLFAGRMEQANEILSRPDAAGVPLEAQGTNLTSLILSGVPLFGNAFIPPEYRQYLQAQRDFVNAVLRKESGAVITEPEFANARQQYFPQPYDDQATIDQKRRNRELATALIAAGASREAIEAAVNSVGPPPPDDATGQDPVRISDFAEADAFEVGTVYVGPDGVTRTRGPDPEVPPNPLVNAAVAPPPAAPPVQPVGPRSVQTQPMPFYGSTNQGIMGPGTGSPSSRVTTMYGDRRPATGEFSTSLPATPQTMPGLQPFMLAHNTPPAPGFTVPVGATMGSLAEADWRGNASMTGPPPQRGAYPGTIIGMIVTDEDTGISYHYLGGPPSEQSSWEAIQ